MLGLCNDDRGYNWFVTINTLTSCWPPCISPITMHADSTALSRTTVSSIAARFSRLYDDRWVTTPSNKAPKHAKEVWSKTGEHTRNETPKDCKKAKMASIMTSPHLLYEEKIKQNFWHCQRPSQRHLNTLWRDSHLVGVMHWSSLQNTEGSRARPRTPQYFQVSCILTYFNL